MSREILLKTTTKWIGTEEEKDITDWFDGYDSIDEDTIMKDCGSDIELTAMDMQGIGYEVVANGDRILLKTTTKWVGADQEKDITEWFKNSGAANIDHFIYMCMEELDTEAREIQNLSYEIVINNIED